MATEQDRRHLLRALELAEGGRGRVSPNPLVGAVIVRDGELLGEGFHAAYGDLHAETAALADCARRGNDPAGATMYVALEPCAHEGKQPACAPALVSAGIARVVVASEDPSEKASGRGLGILRDEGVEVELASGPEATAARLLNQPFRKHARTGLPHVALKLAMTLDGRVASGSGDSRWISGESSRRLVHRWRAEADAVAVGIGTVLADDPLLTARDVDVPHQPARVVFDSSARLPLDSSLIATVSEAPLIVVASSRAEQGRVEALRAAGADVVLAGEGSGPEALRPALAEIGRRDVTSLLLEGGPALAGAFLDAGEIDETRIFIAPKLLGGDARPALEGGEGETMEQAILPLAVEWEQVGDDMLARARLREW